jgi:glycosyltransferase involved in cell wall biosynthesis
MRMRILIIAEVFLPKIDGVVHRTLNLIRQLVRCNDQVTVLCPQDEDCSGCPVPVVAFPSFSFPLYPEYRIGLPDKRLPGVARDFAPDVVHYVNPFGFGFRCYDMLERAGIHLPSVFSFHTLYGEFVKKYPLLKPLSRVLWWLTREYHNCADINITVSNVMQKELVKRGFRRVECWPPAVDSEIFWPQCKRASMRAKLARGQPERPLLLTVSRLAPEKNVGFLASVLERLPDACLAIVGDGPQRQELKQRFPRDRTYFVGYLKGEELAAAYASADAFIYASETETMGNVVLEAMACGTAVVAPDAAGIPSLVANGKTGFLYPPGDLAEAARLTRVLIDDGELRQQFGENSRETVQNWTWENSVDRVRQLYRDSIEEFGARRIRSTLSHRLAGATNSGLVSTFKALAALSQRRSEAAVVG